MILVFVIEYKPELIENQSLYFFLKINIGVAMFFFFRFLLGFLLGFLFDVKQQQMILSFTKMSYLFNSMLFILPFLLFTFFIFLRLTPLNFFISGFAYSSNFFALPFKLMKIQSCQI